MLVMMTAVFGVYGGDEQDRRTLMIFCGQQHSHHDQCHCDYDYGGEVVEHSCGMYIQFRDGRLR